MAINNGYHRYRHNCHKNVMCNSHENLIATPIILMHPSFRWGLTTIEDSSLTCFLTWETSPSSSLSIDHQQLRLFFPLRDCGLTCHKPCHIRVDNHCLQTSLPNMELWAPISFFNTKLTFQMSFLIFYTLEVILLYPPFALFTSNCEWLILN